MALLLPDPCDEHCPDAFKQKARQILLGMHGRPQGWTTTIESDQGLRKIILKFIANFACWDNAADRTHLDVSRALVKAAHGEDPPLVVDPFAGGGSIPLEALRLGCEAFASDLNPVACLILKVMLEDIPRHLSATAQAGGPGLPVRVRTQTGLAEELRKVGGEIKRQAEQELADLYPKDPSGATPIALSVGAHGALRSAELRGGDSADAFVLAVQEAQSQVGATTPGRAIREGATKRRVRGLRAEGG